MANTYKEEEEESPEAREPMENLKQERSSSIDEKPHLTPAEVTSEVDQQLSNKFAKYISYGVLSVITFFLGVLATVIWDMNKTISEVKGQYLSPAHTIEYLGRRIDSLEKVNKDIANKLHQQEIDNLQEQIKNLRSKK